MNLLLFLTVMVTSFIVVRIGAIAFQLTGLEWSMAKFQALSCFTSTGFTTKEAELITGSSQRRRIASILIVLGHAGLVTMIATFANTIRPRVTGWSLPFLPGSIPAALQPWISLAVIIVAVYVIYRAFTNSKLARKLTNVLRENVIKKEIVKPVSFEELTVATGGYGVSRIDVCSDSLILNKTLSESELRRHDITVLAIESGDKTIPNPSADIKILLGDRLICFGKLENIRKSVCNVS
ncbi:MAG: TrkA C-terminal domain-containing protein [Planctomycetota bacterium]